MRRANAQLIAALMTGLSAALMGGTASAGWLRSGCLGALGDQHILFDASGLYIAGGKAPAGKPREATSRLILDAVADVEQAGGFIQFGRKSGFTAFVVDKSDDPRAMAFSRIDDNKQTQKVVLTERSSKQVWHTSTRVCSREAITDLYQKVYRYERDGEPARDITAMCAEDQLTTNGGRQDCPGEKRR